MNKVQKEELYVIHFISDLHGFWEGIDSEIEDDYGKSIVTVGGINAILKILRRLRSELISPQPPDQLSKETSETVDPKNILLCLGGDIVRNYTSRLIYEENVHEAWKHLINLLINDENNIVAYTYGNHTVHDFQNTFLYITKPLSICGCTRNVDWVEASGVPDPPGSIDCISMNKKIPSCSSHCDNEDKNLRFIGLVTQEEKNIQGYPIDKIIKDTHKKRLFIIRNSDVYMKEFLPQNCMIKNCGTDKDPVIIHLAHYSDDQPADFGYSWYEIGKNSGNYNGKPGRPHFILKGHDHTDPEDQKEGPKNGVVDRESRSDGNWVPTFGAGSDGENIGQLQLRLKGKEIHYNWKTFPIGSSDNSKSVLYGLAPLLPDSKKTISQIDFPKFGGSENNVDLLYRAVCLLLKGMLNRYESKNKIHISITSPRSIVRFCYIPNKIYVPTTQDEVNHWANWLTRYFKKESQKKIARIRNLIELKKGNILQNKIVDEIKGILSLYWTKKIDEWDLKHVYGRGQPIYVYSISDKNILKRGIEMALTNLAKTILPPPFPVSFRDRYRSLCIRFMNSTYLLFKPEEKNDKIDVYEIKYDVDKEVAGTAFLLSKEKISLDNFLEKIYHNKYEIFISMVSFIRKSFGWATEKNKKEIPDIKPNHIKNDLLKPFSQELEHNNKGGRAPLFAEIQSFLKENENSLQKGNGPKFWRPGD